MSCASNVHRSVQRSSLKESTTDFERNWASDIGRPAWSVSSNRGALYQLCFASTSRLSRSEVAASTKLGWLAEPLVAPLGCDLGTRAKATNAAIRTAAPARSRGAGSRRALRAGCPWPPVLACRGLPTGRRPSRPVGLSLANFHQVGSRGL